MRSLVNRFLRKAKKKKLRLTNVESFSSRTLVAMYSCTFLDRIGNLIFVFYFNLSNNAFPHVLASLL